jgi:hypothetical protein
MFALFGSSTNLWCSLFAPLLECDNCVTQGETSFGQRVRPSVVPKGETGQHSCRFEFAQPGSEHVRRHSEVALQIAVPLRFLEQSLDNEKCPPGTDDVEGGGEVAHSAVSVSGFIQNGE